ncbi:MAG: LD-carboxypeptidase [Ignavibacteriales bacterium]|nr:LD-carboxypeptidase [Ignavibacteriales bacterium]
MNRRKFLRNSATLTIASAVGVKSLMASKLISDENVIKPKKLKAGDTVGLIAPGSYITNEELVSTIANLETLGFKVRYSKYILEQNGYLSGNDEQRAYDIHEMFADKNIKGILCARGGYGCMRILDLLDYELIKNNPKCFIGFSDITALLYGIYQKTGLVCFHGPVGISSMNDYTLDYLKKTVMEKRNSLVIKSAVEENEETNSAYKKYVITSGSAEGILVGGNLSIVAALVGTPYFVGLENKILFLEEIGEEPYRIDRMLTQLILSGEMKKVKGIVLGVFRDCESKEEDPSYEKSFSLSQVLFDRLQNLGVPVMYGMSFGHIRNKITIPFGVKAKLDTKNQTLTLKENSVVN